jgi:hypothetical protein
VKKDDPRLQVALSQECTESEHMPLGAAEEFPCGNDRDRSSQDHLTFFFLVRRVHDSNVQH